MQITRQNVLDVLENGWGGYVGRFQSLTPLAQADFLKHQGYARLGDLLAHIVAWWETGLQAIRSYQSDPQARQPEIDVDSFNARAVAEVRGLTDQELIRAFETRRGEFVQAVNGLSEADFRDARILKQLEMELVGHLEDHKIP